MARKPAAKKSSTRTKTSAKAAAKPAGKARTKTAAKKPATKKAAPKATAPKAASRRSPAKVTTKTKAPAKKAAAKKTTAKKATAKKATEKAGPAKKTAVKKTGAKKAPARKSAATKAPKPIQLFYWPTPNGWKISIALEEMKLPYEVTYVDIMKGDQFKPDFLAISPNNRMPAIIDPHGPSNKPISVFESGAILHYLGEKTGKFLPKQPRKRVEVSEWLFWQMGGLGPMAGQAHHFRQYAPEEIQYGIDRYTNEVHRLYGVMEKRLEGRDYLCGTYSIADIAAWPWVAPHKRQGQDLDEFPNLKAWFGRIAARPAVERGFRLGRELRENVSEQDQEKARQILFNQRARD